MTDPRVPRLMLVTDRHHAQMPLPDLARSAVRGGVDAIQVREKDLSERELLSLAEAVCDSVGDRARVFVNGSIEVARRLGIGVHLPEAGPSFEDARRRLGRAALIGRSVHSAASARDSQGCHYLIAGHVFPTTSKTGLPPIGLDGLSAIVDAAACPVLAIGGIDQRNSEDALRAGAYGVAVISAINHAARPEERARRLRDLIERMMQEAERHGN